MKKIKKLLPKGNIPSVSSLSEYFYVGFPVDRITNTRLLWLNERWLLSEGVDVLDPDVRQQIIVELVETFGVSTRDVGTAGTSTSSMLYADRYGGTNGTAHGGSGRCGAFENYNAKGIGATPLTPSNVPWSHSHGYMSVAEAVREAICSEIAAAELPFGSIPIVAILDTGKTFRKDENSEVQRGAIVVRPNFLRPAHFQRSIFFGSVGTNTSDQYRDAVKVSDTIRSVTGPREVHDPLNVNLRKMVAQIAEQTGASQALRLWQGLFVTSNISVDGAFVDFGGFRSLPDWRKCRGSNGEVFGNEIHPISAAADSLLGYFKKYAGEIDTLPTRAELLSIIKCKLNEGFSLAVASGIGIDCSYNASSAEKVVNLFKDYYSIQQKQRTTIESVDVPTAWLYDHLSSRDSIFSRQDIDYSIVKEIKGSFYGASRSDIYSSNLNRAIKWLKPRAYLYYSVTMAHISKSSNWFTGEVDIDRSHIMEYIHKHVAESRRYWHSIPRHLDVHTMYSNSYSSVIIGFNVLKQRREAWVEGIVIDKSVCVLGHRIKIEHLPCDVDVSSTQVQFPLEVQSSIDLEPILTFGGVKIDLSRQQRTEL